MRRQPFDFDISVTADKKRRARGRGFSGVVESSERVCERQGCDRPGKYRAPKSPDNLEEFHWFCLDHVREYNLRWNFFEFLLRFRTSSGSSPRTASGTGRRGRSARRRTGRRRRTPRAGRGSGSASTTRARFLGDKATLNPGAERTRRRQLPPTERRALEILEAQDTQSKAEIRRQYKALVKDLHPDMNGGRRDDEARLAEVVWAWEQIKGSRSFRD